MVCIQDWSVINKNKHRYHYNHIFCLVQDGPILKRIKKGPLSHSRVSRFMTIHFMATPNRGQFSKPDKTHPGKPIAAVARDGEISESLI